MQEGSPKSGIRRGIRRRHRIGLVLVALSVLALLLPNLWLASSPGRVWLSRKIQNRTGLDTRVGGASVTPWGGVRVRDLKLLQPAPLRAAVAAPLFHAESIRLDPVWPAWLRGRLELHSVSLDSPRLVIPVELLAEIATSRAGTVAAQPPVASIGPVPAPEVTPPPPPSPPRPPIAAPPPPGPVPEEPIITTIPTAWIHLRHASCAIISATSGRPLLEVDDLRGSIPIAGGNARSALRVGSVRAAGKSGLTGVGMTLEWRAPMLAMQAVEAQIEGLRVIVGGRIGLLPGLPARVEASIPEQTPRKLSHPSGLEAEAGKAAANARFNGFLLAPSTWQGDLVAEAATVTARGGGHEAVFDRGGIVTVLRGGMVSCVDARLIGDELSFLGNATVLANGRMAAAVRMVAPPGNIEPIVQRIFPALEPPLSITPLSTPQRAAFDVRLSGHIRQPFIQPGVEGPTLRLGH